MALYGKKFCMALYGNFLRGRFVSIFVWQCMATQICMAMYGNFSAILGLKTAKNTDFGLYRSEIRMLYIYIAT